MADPEVTLDPVADEEMAEVEVVDPEGAGDADPSGLEDIEPTIETERTTFLEHAANT